MEDISKKFEILIDNKLVEIIYDINNDIIPSLNEKKVLLRTIGKNSTCILMIVQIENKFIVFKCKIEKLNGMFVLLLFPMQSYNMKDIWKIHRRKKYVKRISGNESIDCKNKYKKTIYRDSIFEFKDIHVIEIHYI